MFHPISPDLIRALEAMGVPTIKTQKVIIEIDSRNGVSVYTQQDADETTINVVKAAGEGLVVRVASGG